MTATKSSEKRRGNFTVKFRERRFDKFRGMDKVEEELNATLANYINAEKLAAMKFTVKN